MDRNTTSNYNGWTNYATWRINLEWFDGNGKEWYDRYETDAHEMREALQEHVEEMLSYQADEDSTVYRYAMAFTQVVNWLEIAEHIVRDYHHYGCEHCGGAVEDEDDKFCSERCKRNAIRESQEERI